LYLYAPQILGIVFGAEYRSISTPVLQVLAWTLLPQFVLLVLVREAIDSGRTVILALQGLLQLVLLSMFLYQAGLSAKGLTAETASHAALVAATGSVLLPIISRFASQRQRPKGSV
jgi:drug/metabolite transporter (DMT)-like permease